MRLPLVHPLLLALALAGCGGDEAPTTSPQPANPASGEAELAAAGIELSASNDSLVATVGSGGVSEVAFRDAASRTPPRNGLSLDEEERNELIQQLITEEALWQEAVKRGLYRDPKVRKIMVNLLLRQQVYDKVRAADFSHDDLKAYFDEHSEEFVVPEKVQIKRIFLAVDDKRSLSEALSLAADLRKKLVGHPDRFKDMALEHSEDPYKRRGGDLGYIAREGKPGIDPAVVSVAFELDVNEVSEPFEAGGGVNIVMTAARRERVERTFDQMKGSVLRRLKNDRYKTLTDQFVNGIRKNLDIEIDEALIGSMELGPGRRGMVASPDEHGVLPDEVDEVDEHGHGDED